MTAIVTVNFQIMGKGSIEIGGATSVSLAGPYWNTITIVAPATPYVTFTVLPSEWDFVMWGGEVIETSPGIARLEFPVDVSASYHAVAVFAESTGTPVRCAPQNCYNTYTSAPPEPTHESIRVARRCECAKTPPPAPIVCKPVSPPQRVWVRQTPAQNTPPVAGYAVYEAVSACDAADNVYTGLRWTNDAFKITNSLTVYSHTVTGEFRWRRDLLLGESSFNIPRSVRSYVACLHDAFTRRLFVAAHMIDISTSRLYFHFFCLNPSTGAVISSRVYTETGAGALDLPPLHMTTDGAGTLFLASTNAATVFVQSLRMDGTFDQIQYWAGLTNTLSTPLVARCYGLEYDSEGYLYMSLVTDQTIAGGTRSPPFSTYLNSALVKLTAAPIGLVWGYQDPALNVDGFSNVNAITVLPDHKLCVLYSTTVVGTFPTVRNVRFARISSAGVFIDQHLFPEYAGELMDMLDLCRTPTGDRIFFMMGPYYLLDPEVISFGEMSRDGTILWNERNETYSPLAGLPLISTGLAATDRYLWVAYNTLAPILDQVQTAVDDSVVIEFRISNCPIPPTLSCDCSHRREPQRHRTVHHRTERDRMLAEVVRCPLYFHNRNTGGLCSEQHATVHSSTTPLLGTGAGAPHALHTRRPLHRIRGIEEICKPVRGVSGAELTARIRARTEASHATLTRHSEHFRVTPPPPARLCPPPRPPTRPIAPVTPCNIGNQRVDYTTGKS